MTVRTLKRRPLVTDVSDYDLMKDELTHNFYEADARYIVSIRDLRYRHLWRQDRGESRPRLGSRVGSANSAGWIPLPVAFSLFFFMRRGKSFKLAHHVLKDIQQANPELLRRHHRWLGLKTLR